MGSNILIKLKGQRARETMLNNLTTHLGNRSAATDATAKASALTLCEATIESYIENCKDINDNYKGLLEKFLNFKGDPSKLSELQLFITHENTKLTLLKTNLEMKLKILT